MNRHPLCAEIATFYRRWHSFEGTLGADNGTIIDFDFCPPEYVSDSTPFADRMEVLATVMKLREAHADAAPSEFCNYEHLGKKLEGSEAYVRALMGERFSIESYIRATLGVGADRASMMEIEALRDEVERALASIGVRHLATDLARYEAVTLDANVTSFGVELREIATRMVAFVRDELGLHADPDYTIEEVQEDEYWTNFVDGKLGSPLRLRFNTHPRKSYRKGLAFEMAAHEVAAHLLNILELSLSERQGRVDAPALNTTLHSCELIQMEGLAQSLIHLLEHPFEVSPFALVNEALRSYHMALLQNAHLDLEEGKLVDEVVRSVTEAAPFLNELGVLSELRDRSRSVCFRTLIFVYYPSKKQFMRAAAAPLGARKSFLKRMYQELWTPSQIDEQLAAMVTKSAT